jgi:transcription antitermination factor NusG
MSVLDSTNTAECWCIEALRWFAIRVKSNREQVVGASLSVRGYEIFLPMYKEWPSHERAPQKLRLLWPGYVFSRFDMLKRVPVITVPGVVHVVGIGKVPCPVPDQEIESLRLVTESRFPVKPVPYIAIGETVHITDGPPHRSCGHGGRSEARALSRLDYTPPAFGLSETTD